MNKIKNLIRLLLIVFFLTDQGLSGRTMANNPGGHDQASDSLSLEDIIRDVVTKHPTVKSAEEALNNADARIGLARTGYYPQVDLSANYSNMGPVIKLTIPDMGTFQLFPENNYSAAINYRQVVYDFGRTRQNIAIENENKVIGEQYLEQVKQKMALAAVNSFYTLAFLQEAVKIKDEQLVTLKEHLKYVETMKSTGTATDYQILSTRVKISSVQSQKVDLETAIEIQQSYLNCLLGQDDTNKPVVRKELRINPPASKGDSLLSYALNNRDELLIDREKANLALLRYDLTKSLNRPIISFMASGGAKNGYVPYLDRIRANYVVGLGISVPLFDGMKTKYNLQQVESAIRTLDLDQENTKRHISDELTSALAYMNAASQKLSQFELQLNQALKAYSLAEVSFKSGTVTNLDLLDASTSVSESRLMLLKARIDYVASIYRLKVALGERLY
jgi:outer membrane protein